MLNNSGNRSAAQRSKMNWICVSSSSNVCKQAKLTWSKNQAPGCVIRKSTRELPMRMFGPMREELCWVEDICILEAELFSFLNTEETLEIATFILKFSLKI
ncbi:hypothetical protein TNIN_425731 [Trichonephila inaurata madagascariensis]|uniref:Uncharacterized protein n=1 Tax=Trichonephila inaurata madagascariensis TaxID=2747483 RepID=A0A8X7CPK5_9ARAC|nr:hypothetical protein TNIN_425731 [Trichonephila inaurata madagascariensis]